MTLIAAIIVVILGATGAFLAMSRDIIRCIIGLSLIGAAANIMLFAAGRLQNTAPPIIPEGMLSLTEAANPLPQALVLTAIVIGFSLLALSLLFALYSTRIFKTRDLGDLRASEPENQYGEKPKFFEDR